MPQAKLFPTQRPSLENQSVHITLSQTPNLESVLAEMTSGTNDLHWLVVLTSCTTWGKLSDLTISSDIKWESEPDELEQVVNLLWIWK